MLRKAFFGLMLLAFVALTGWALRTLLTSPGVLPDVVVDPNLDVSVDFSARSVELVQGREGRRLWKVVATVADYDREGDLVRVVSPEVLYYPEGEGDAETGPLKVTAEKGEVTQSSSEVRMGPDVRGWYGPAELTAEALFFDGKRTVTFTGNVRVVRQDSVLTAPVMHIDLETGDVKAESGVRVELPSATESPQS